MNDGVVGTAIVVPNEMLEASAYVASHDGAPLRGGGFVDGSTGTRWDIAGRAIAGELRGGAERLAQAPSFHEFWFSVAGANPRIGFMAMANETCGRQCPVTNGPRRPAKIT